MIIKENVLTVVLEKILKCEGLTECGLFLQIWVNVNLCVGLRPNIAFSEK